VDAKSRLRLGYGMAATALVCGATAAPGAALGAIHQVGAGESLWQIAARDGISPGALARANGLASTTQIRTGSVLVIPGAGSSPSTIAGPSAALSAAPDDADDGDADTDDLETASSPSAVTSTPAVTESTSASAPSAARLATAAPRHALIFNGLSHSSTGAGLQASPGRVTSGQIASIAAANGVPPSLASAIAWQESGFNNAAVSSANARGVMQLLPGTWQWVQGNLTRAPLDPFSPIDNVKAGVLYLHSLLRQTGSPDLAAAAYYQGLGGVRRHGLLPETQRYVNSVAALRRRFGGG